SSTRSIRIAASTHSSQAHPRTSVHDLRILREQLDLLRDGMRRRGALDALAPIIDRGAEAERERRTLIQSVEEKKAARNANAQDVAKRKKAKENADDLI